jgi:hypothetical protein
VYSSNSYYRQKINFSWRALFVTALFACGPVSAYALSCASTRLDEQVIKNAEIIFEGVVLEERELSFWEKVGLFIE